MRVVTVVPTIERFDLVHAFEKSYAETAPPEEPAVFVAMGSDDDTAGYLSAKAEQGRPYYIVRNPDVVHFAKAINHGAKIALEQRPDADVLMLSNDDIVLRPGWYEALAEAFQGGADVVGAKLVYPKPREAPSDAPNLIQHFGKWFTLDLMPFHVMRNLPETHELSQDVRFFPDVTFALVAIRRELWEDLGGLDEAYVGGFEDDDWCLRAKEKGAMIVVHPKFSAVHKESATTGMDTENKTVQWQRFSEQWIDNGRIQWALGLLQGWAK